MLGKKIDVMFSPQIASPFECQLGSFIAFGTSFFFMYFANPCMLRNLSISLNIEEVNLLLFLIPFCEFNFVIQYENSIDYIHWHLCV